MVQSPLCLKPFDRDARSCSPDRLAVELLAVVLGSEVLLRTSDVQSSTECPRRLGLDLATGSRQSGVVPPQSENAFALGLGARIAQGSEGSKLDDTPIALEAVATSTSNSSTVNDPSAARLSRAANAWSRCDSRPPGHTRSGAAKSTTEPIDLGQIAMARASRSPLTVSSSARADGRACSRPTRARRHEMARSGARTVDAALPTASRRSRSVITQVRRRPPVARICRRNASRRPAAPAAVQ